MEKTTWFDGSEVENNLTARVVIVAEDRNGSFTTVREYYFETHSAAVNALNKAEKLLYKER